MSARYKSEIKHPKADIIFLFPDQDSNLDKRYQKPAHYHYTIRQYLAGGTLPKKECKYRTIFLLRKEKVKIGLTTGKELPLMAKNVFRDSLYSLLMEMLT